MSDPAAFKDRLAKEQLHTLLCTRPFKRGDWEASCSEYLHMRLGSAQPVLRRDAALDCLEAFTAATLSFGAGFCDVWQRREAIYVETEVQFAGADWLHRSIPCFVIARTTHRLLQDLRLYFDPTPIYFSEPVSFNRSP